MNGRDDPELACDRLAGDPSSYWIPDDEPLGWACRELPCLVRPESGTCARCGKTAISLLAAPGREGRAA